MVSDKPLFNLILRTFLLVINCILLGWAILSHPDWLLISNLILILILQLILFARFQLRLQRALNSVLTSLEENIESGNGFDGLRGELSNIVIQRLKRIQNHFLSQRIEVEKQNYFLQALIDNIRVGIIICDEQGRIEFVNNMALDLLQMRSISTLDQLKDSFPRLFSSIHELSQRQAIVQHLKLKQGSTTISLRSKYYKLQNKTKRILSMHLIQQELEEQEIESWQKLIRVLTHEIMNSTGPISSTLDTLIEILSDEKTGSVKQQDLLKQEMISDVLRGLHIIKGRSMGLSHFVQHFRSLTLLPKPSFQPVMLGTFFTHVLFLMNRELTEHSIKTEVKLAPSTLLVNADPILLEQVLINLLKNSIEALKNRSDGLILLDACQGSDNQIILGITDNGKGIPEELLDQVFIPFFTTKENGSGIGLSLSRQIIRQHGGTLELYSEPNIRTTIRMALPG